MNDTSLKKMLFVSWLGLVVSLFSIIYFVRAGNLFAIIIGVIGAISSIVAEVKYNDG